MLSWRSQVRFPFARSSLWGHGDSISHAPLTFSTKSVQYEKCITITHVSAAHRVGGPLDSRRGSRGSACGAGALGCVAPHYTARYSTCCSPDIVLGLFARTWVWLGDIRRSIEALQPSAFKSGLHPECVRERGSKAKHDNTKAKQKQHVWEKYGEGGRGGGAAGRAAPRRCLSRKRGWSRWSGWCSHNMHTGCNGATHVRGVFTCGLAYGL